MPIVQDFHHRLATYSCRCVNFRDYKTDGSFFKLVPLKFIHQHLIVFLGFNSSRSKTKIFRWALIKFVVLPDFFLYHVYLYIARTLSVESN